MVIDIFIIIRTRKRAVTHGAQVHHADQAAGRDKRLQNQMIFLMLSSIGIFFVTTLPLTIGHIQSVHVDLATVDLAKLLTTLTILNWLQSLNCAVSVFPMPYEKEYVIVVQDQFLRALPHVHTVSTRVYPTGDRRSRWTSTGNHCDKADANYCCRTRGTSINLTLLNESDRTSVLIQQLEVIIPSSGVFPFEKIINAKKSHIHCLPLDSLPFRSVKSCILTCTLRGSSQGRFIRFFF